MNHFYYYCSGPIKNPKHYNVWNIKLELWYPNKLQLKSVSFLLVFRIILLPKNFSYSESLLKECVLSRAISKHVSLPTVRRRFWSEINEWFLIHSGCYISKINHNMPKKIEWKNHVEYTTHKRILNSASFPKSLSHPSTLTQWRWCRLYNTPCSIFIKNDKGMSLNLQKGDNDNILTSCMWEMNTGWASSPPERWQYYEYNFLYTFNGEWFNNCLFKILHKYWSSHECMYVDIVFTVYIMWLSMQCNHPIKTKFSTYWLLLICLMSTIEVTALQNQQFSYNKVVLP